MNALFVFLLFLLAGAAFVDLGLFALAWTYQHAALWLAALSLAVVPLGLGAALGTMLDAERGRSEQEWARARAIWGEEEETGQDIDGDGIIGEPPRTTFVHSSQVLPARAVTRTPGQKARVLCQWCYRRAAQNLGYGQHDRGKEWSRAEYDAGMEILVHVGLIAGRGQQGVKGELVVVPLDGDWTKAERTALAIFDTLVVDE